MICINCQKENTKCIDDMLQNGYVAEYMSVMIVKVQLKLNIKVIK